MKKIKNWFSNLFRANFSNDHIKSDLERYLARRNITDTYMLDYWIREWNRSFTRPKGW